MGAAHCVGGTAQHVGGADGHGSCARHAPGIHLQVAKFLWHIETLEFLFLPTVKPMGRTRYNNEMQNILTRYPSPLAQHSLKGGVESSVSKVTRYVSDVGIFLFKSVIGGCASSARLGLHVLSVPDIRRVIITVDTCWHQTYYDKFDSSESVRDLAPGSSPTPCWSSAIIDVPE